MRRSRNRNRPSGSIPLSLYINVDLAWVYYHARQFDQAIAQAQKTILLERGFSQGHQVLGLSLAQQGKFAEAIASMQQARNLDDIPGTSGNLGSIYAMAGKREEALKILNEVKARFTQTANYAGATAEIYSVLGEKEEAFDWLQKAFEERNGLMTMLKVARQFDNLRSDPRFTELLKKVRLDK